VCLSHVLAQGEIETLQLSERAEDLLACQLKMTEVAQLTQQLQVQLAEVESRTTASVHSSADPAMGQPASSGGAAKRQRILP
jgi:hypothetical protein